MPLPTDEKRLALAKEVIQTLDNLNGLHPGHRPAHAKGTLVAGTFYSHARRGFVVTSARRIFRRRPLR